MLAELLIAFSLLGSEAGSSPKPFDYGQVERKIMNGNLSSAAAVLEGRLKAEERDFRAHLLLGIVRQEEHLPEQALKEFRRAHELRPQDPSPYVNIGKVLVAEGQPGAGAEQFANAIRLDPQNATAHSDLGVLRYEQKRWPEAIAELRTALRIAPGDTASWLVLFQSYLAIRDYGQAGEASARIAELAPPSSKIFRDLGAMQAAAGDYEGAIANLKKSLAIAPDSYETAYDLALAWLRSGHADQAAALLEPFRVSRENAELENLLGDVYEKLGRPLDAVRAFQLGAELDSKNQEYRFDYVVELLNHKNFEAAFLVARAATLDFPTSLKLWLALSGALYGKGSVQEAHNVLVKTSHNFQNSILPLYLRSVISDASGKPDDGLISQTQAYLQRHLEDSTAYLILGRAKAQEGKLGEAISSLNRSLAIKDDSAEAHFAIAKVYSNEGNWQQVAAHCARAVQLSPEMATAWYRLALALHHLGRKGEANSAMNSFKRLDAQAKSRNQVNTFIYTLR